MLTDILLRDLLPSIVTAAAVLAGLWLLSWAATRAITRAARRFKPESLEDIAEMEAWSNQLSRFIRRGLELLAGVAALIIILRGFGLGGLPRISWEGVAAWLTGPGLKILLVLGGAYVLSRIAGLLISRLPSLLVIRKGTPAEIHERRQRLETISRLLQSAATTLLLGAGGLVALRELGFDITPILTGLGIGGLALGFGAQNLVRDLISGFFLILENQVNVGDVARINGKGGLVEAVRLRTVVLRGLDGAVHVIPNGAITELSNLTQDFSYYVMDLGVAYKENVDHVTDVVREVAAGMRRHPAYAEFILEDLEVLGVDDFADSAVVIKMRIKTAPLKQWIVGRELRRRIKNTFDEKGIEIPFPHLSLYMGEASKPFAVRSEAAGSRA